MLVGTQVLEYRSISISHSAVALFQDMTAERVWRPVNVIIIKRRACSNSSVFEWH